MKPETLSGHCWTAYIHYLYLMGSNTADLPRLSTPYKPEPALAIQHNPPASPPADFLPAKPLPPSPPLPAAPSHTPLLADRRQNSPLRIRRARASRPRGLRLAASSCAFLTSTSRSSRSNRSARRPLSRTRKRINTTAPAIAAHRTTRAQIPPTSPVSQATMPAPPRPMPGPSSPHAPRRQRLSRAATAYCARAPYTPANSRPA